MLFLHKYLVHECTLYLNHFCTVAICCPSRVNIWTGRAAHNTSVTDISSPYGGYPEIVQEGYNTFYSGKLWNNLGVTNSNSPYVGGFNASDFFLDPYTYEYYNTWMSRNSASPVSYKDQYSPDVIAKKAYGFLEEATAHKDRPWLLTVAPVAPDSNVKIERERHIRD
ncbi:alkaline-phosphatase-like protein [Dendryphion nanum]|uniref:Alkaline-phosphatase-like protein n=1 Tax=Dendryphion nanum TaxID=256645 RepID=A0A9P9D4Y2_9PLEO|nr:alkaline-phosphatase-like protein [Dendryphion nanum]